MQKDKKAKKGEKKKSKKKYIVRTSRWVRFISYDAIIDIPPKSIKWLRV